MKNAKEFGGAGGAVMIMIFSHILPFYFVLSLKYSSGGLYFPVSLSDLLIEIKDTFTPTWFSTSIFLGFWVIQLTLAIILPGVYVKGLPVPSENDRQYLYKCNGLAAWYLTLVLLPIIHFSGVFSLTSFVDHFGPILSIAVISSDIVSLVVHFYAIITNNDSDRTDSFVYDFFMGIWLNPRITLFSEDIDLKLISEARLSWLLLFILSFSAAIKQYELFQTISLSMLFILFAQLLYVNACLKGEECIVVTWDIFHEKWGWMLIYWNLAGVPFVYTFHAQYILVNSIRTSDLNGNQSNGLLIIMFIMLCLSYYVWDSCLAQKIYFRMKERKIFVNRRGFPQMPWSELKNPKYLQTKVGDSLLIDGWWKYCRKPAYTADIIMSILWALSCHQWPGVLPFFYPMFFLIMILHRYTRDVEKCRKKYGKDWQTYCEQVPYRFLPGIY